MNKFGDLYKLQKQAKQVTKKLQNTHIESEEEGITVTLDGKQKVLDVNISDDAYQNKSRVEKNLVKALNKGISRSQQIGAEEMKDIMGDMGMGGLPGMQ